MTQTRFTRRAAFAKCPVHSAVYDMASIILVKRPYFSKEEVIKKLRFGAIADAINWDYIRDVFLQRSDRIDLVPLSKAFFDRPQTAEEAAIREKNMKTTSRLIAVGKATYGYASADEENGYLCFRHAKFKEAINNGVATAFNAYREAVSAKLGHDVLDQPQEPTPITPQIEQQKEPSNEISEGRTPSAAASPDGSSEDSSEAFAGSDREIRNAG